MSECVGRGPMDMARAFAHGESSHFNQAVDVVFQMMKDRALIPCPVHDRRYVISLKWARENDKMDLLPDESLLSEPCMTEQEA